MRFGLHTLGRRLVGSRNLRLRRSKVRKDYESEVYFVMGRRLEVVVVDCKIVVEAESMSWASNCMRA